MRTLQDFQRTLAKLKAKKEFLEKEKIKLESENDILQKHLEDLQEAKKILQLIATKTQQELEYRICEIVDLAIGTIFEEPVKFKISYVAKRGKTEAEIYLQDKEGNKLDLNSDIGGGLADLISTSLRLTLWKLSNSNNVLIMDEPFKFLSANYSPMVSRFLKQITEKLNLQLITVTHKSDLFEDIGKRINIEKINNISKVKE